MPRDLGWDTADVEAYANRMEEVVERQAPGFRALIRTRLVQGPADLQAGDANLVQGATNAGSAAMHQQLLFRPVGRSGCRTARWSAPRTDASTAERSGATGAAVGQRARASRFTAI